MSPRQDDESPGGQLEKARASEGAGAAAVAAAPAVLGEEGGAKPVATGIGWITILSVFVTQVSFVGLLFWLATPAIRESKGSRLGACCSHVNPNGRCISGKHKCSILEEVL